MVVSFGDTGRHQPGEARAASQKVLEAGNMHAMPPGYGRTRPTPPIPYWESLVKRSLHFLICIRLSHRHLAGRHEEQVVAFSTTHSVGHTEGDEDLLNKLANTLLFGTTWFSS